MDPLSLTLILLAAFVHIVPHVALKGAEERGAFVWWMLAVNAVLYAPVLLLGPIPKAAWPFILASGAVEAIYIFTLSRAYETGDVSVVYPLARGSSPVFLLVFATLVLREPITAAGVMGVALIAIGILVGARMQWNGWALLSGAAIATYTTIDKAASPLVHPLPYIYLVLFVNLVIYTPFMRIDAIRATWKAARWRIVIAAATAPIAYALVLTAMRRGALASYAGAIREVSIVVAAIAGVVIFRERAGTARVIGAIVIVAGVVLIAAWGQVEIEVGNPARAALLVEKEGVMSIGELRCPAIRSLVKGEKLRHVEFLAQVHDVVRLLSGQNRELSSDEPGSIANVAGFFAIHNHSVNGNRSGGSLRKRLRSLLERIGELVDAASGKDTDRRFDLRFFRSRGDHPGTVDFFTKDAAGVFDPAHFENTMAQFAEDGRLTIDGVARMIRQANGADPNATALDLVKSAGEWALMVCALGDPISVDELRAMYRDGKFERLLQGTGVATERQWLGMSIRIFKAIGAAKLALPVHSAFGDDFNDGDDKLCPCIGCNPTAWARS